MLTIMSLNRGMDSIAAKAGTLSTLDNIKGICVGGVSKTSRSAQAVPDPAQGAGATVPVPALRGQAQAKQPSCILQAQPSARS